MTLPLIASPRLSPLGRSPEWSQLEAYQHTITRDQFSRLIQDVYSPDGGFWKYAQINDERVVVYSDPGQVAPLFTLYFASDAAAERPCPVSFHPHEPLREASAEQPLRGVKICLDPGHIGGEWARVEGRYFKIGKDHPIREGELSFITCEHLGKKLEALGATVKFTRSYGEPVTKLRPKDLRDEAIFDMSETTGTNASKLSPRAIMENLKDRSERLFYLVAEIRARAEVVERFKPDLTLCVHYNASAWGDPDRPVLAPDNRLVVFVNGAYSFDELKYDDQKFDLMLRLLQRTAVLEERGADDIASAVAAKLQLPPEMYRDYPTVRRIGENPYVFARNLLANRIFRGPVVYVEGPYMNSTGSYPRFAAGDYEGLRQVAGKDQPSIFREMADAIASGAVEYFTKPVAPPVSAPGQTPPFPLP